MFMLTAVMITQLISASLSGAGPDALQGSGATFACKSWLATQCNYGVVHDGQVALRFSLHRGQSRFVQGVASGDRYMMTMNIDLPQSIASCSEMPHPEAKRPTWCRVSTVQAGSNF